jgi:hypothetical protein
MIKPTINTISMEHHHGDSLLAGISVFGMFIAWIGLSTFGQVIAIAAGVTSLVINYPKLKERVRVWVQKLKS